MQQTYAYLTSILLFFNILTSHSQEKKIPSKTSNVNWWSGMMVQADVASVITSTLMKGDTYSMEGSAQLGINKKIYPVVELGIAGANKEMQSLARFKTNAPFARIGVDINLLSPKKDSKPTNNLFLAGFRLGYSNFSYDLTNLIIKDEYWGGSETNQYLNQSAGKVWYEFVGGIRVEVIKNIYLGWNIRYRNLISKESTGSISPWYIPGYGLNGSSNWGYNYTIGYKF